MLTTTTLGTEAEAQISAENFTMLQREVYRESGIVLDGSKLYLVEARLLPLLKDERLKTLNDLCALLKVVGQTQLRRKVVEAMTTNETLFFRDAPAFEALKTRVLPELMERRKSVRKLNIWSAAASSGQEAYSVAMLLADMGLEGWELRILGTDLNSQVVERARAGRFLQIEVNRGLPAEYLTKYFHRVGAEWQIADRIRKMVEFSQFDLRQYARGLGSFDLVLCRNVLIYFDVETKKKILAEIRSVLEPGGYLLLGCAESTLNLDQSFEKRVFGPASFYQPG
jgi:chemotaxis protein methyltransferase CheR